MVKFDWNKRNGMVFVTSFSQGYFDIVTLKFDLSPWLLDIQLQLQSSPKTTSFWSSSYHIHKVISIFNYFGLDFNLLTCRKSVHSLFIREKHTKFVEETLNNGSDSIMFNATKWQMYSTHTYRQNNSSTSFETRYTQMKMTALILNKNNIKFWTNDDIYPFLGVQYRVDSQMGLRPTLSPRLLLVVAVTVAVVANRRRDRTDGQRSDGMGHVGWRTHRIMSHFLFHVFSI